MSANDLAIVTKGFSFSGLTYSLPGRIMPPGGGPWQVSTDRRVRSLEMLMRRNLDRRLRLTEHAAGMGISASRLAHLFRTETGVSPGRYRKSIRLRETKNLLETTPLSIKEVAARVGLAPSQLAREFRRMYGLTPREFRLGVPKFSPDVAGSAHK